MSEEDYSELVEAITSRIVLASDYASKVNDYSTHVEGCAEDMVEQIMTELSLRGLI